MRSGMSHAAGAAGQEAEEDARQRRGARCAIAIMAKAPRPGFSKTRLCPPLRPDEAAMISGAFLRDTAENLARAAEQAPIAAYAAYTPAGTEALLGPHLGPAVGLMLADGGGDFPRGIDGFGRCLFQAVERLLAAGYAAACVLSSDTPNLPTEALIQAARLLLDGPPDRAVLGTCDDGGYYLLGMTRPHAALFRDIVWSTETVAATTRARAAEVGLALAELPPWYDIDDAASLARLAARPEGYAAPFSRAALQRLDRRDIFAA
ncbi:hypothetical protein AcidC75_07330 [Acidisoma sp. C75]